MGSDDWTWEFSEWAKRAYDQLDAHAQDRISAKLDEIVADEWRDPDAYIEPLTGAPHGKLRIGPFRLGVVVDRETKALGVYTIERRGEAYSPGDDEAVCRFDSNFAPSKERWSVR